MSTYGSLAYNNGTWEITAVPHVMTKVKRIFPRLKQGVTGTVRLAHTAEVARDLEWMLQRYPLAVDAASREHLEQSAEKHRHAEVTLRSILNGEYHRPTGLRVPAIPPRKHQQQASAIVHATGNLLLIDQLGLGKTISALDVLADPEALPALIVMPTHLPDQWEREIKRYWPDLHVHKVKTGKVYDLGTPLFGFPDVVLINYAKLGRGWGHALAGIIRTFIAEEGHELRNVGKPEPSDKYAQATIVAHAARYRMALTGTPVFNYGGDVFNILQVIAPDSLGTEAEFIREWKCHYAGAGKHLSVGDPAALRSHLIDSGLMLHRTRKDIGQELPGLQRIEWPVQTDHNLLNRLSGDIFSMAEAVLNGSREERFVVSGQLDSALRHATGLAKAPFVAEFVRSLLEGGEEKLVLTGHHLDCYGIWRKLLSDFYPVFYTGEQNAKEKAAAVTAFTEGDSRLFVMANRSGAGVDGLQRVCSVVVHGELDWSPAIHLQIDGRLDREGQEDKVLAYYMASTGGTDPLMIERLELKRQQSNPIQNPDAPAFATVEQEENHIKELARRILAGRKVQNGTLP